MTFIVVTLTRARCGPAVTRIMLLIYFATSLTANIWGRLVAARWDWSRADFGSVATAACIVIVTGTAFWVYMRDGRRPNLYFLGRVRR